MGSYQATRNNNSYNEDEVNQREKSQESTENLINAGISVAENIPMAAGYAKAIKFADKATGGAITKKAAKVVNQGLENSPMGKEVQGVINQANDSGLTDTVNQAANIKKGGGFSSSLKNGLIGKSNNNNNNLFSGFDTQKLFTPSFKIKLIICASIFMFFIVVFTVVFAHDDVYNLYLTNNSGMTPTGGPFNGNVDSNMYDGSGLNMLGSGDTLLSRLGQEKIDLINNQIKSDVINAGSGTGNGVATAAYDFIKLLADNGINMTYTYGGGHGAVAEGIQGSWGYGNGLDCSSFVSWALYNGGCKNYTSSTVSGTQATHGDETTADKLKTGDIIANHKHVMLVLKNTGTSVIVAHARGLNYGIVFSENTYESLSGYSLRDMTSYYQQNCSS